MYNNHLARLSALFSWIIVHAPAGLLRHGDPTKKVDLLRLPAPPVRALSGPQLRTVKNVLDLCVPRISSTSCDQPVLVDHAIDASVSSYAVSPEIDGFG